MDGRQFSGKAVLVTGATSGIGRACAIAFAKQGAQVACIGRKQDALAVVADAIESAGGEALPIKADLAIAAEADAVISQAVEGFGGLDVLVNAAGHISTGTIENTSDEAWDEMMNVNVRAVFRLMRQAMPHLIERKGNVVNVSSVTGLRSFPGVLAYCVSKSAVDQLTRCSALEVAAKGVRINAVNPGVVITEIHKRGGMNSDAYEAFLEHSKQTHPLGRVGQPEEIAALVAFLASGEARWITGATYSIDGGRHLTCAR
ncbi:MAG TPA: glucose 1-dehydrogenase [Pyrinomonadaceae bacterium]|nr:glucose 1-dehydrogenase [Pyrinomonadaceae bacterium]